MAMNMPKVETHFMAMQGGIDTSSAATLVKEGFLIDAQNYEQDAVNGGYARVKGYERFDGHASPSAASYWVIGTTATGSVVTGNTLAGATSGATGKVLYVGATYFVLADVTGTFQIAENLQVAAVTQGISTTLAVLSGATTSADDAAFANLAADNQRLNISTLPGTGAVLGVWLYNDTLYAWRNNSGNTAAVMHKSSAAGWVEVPLYKEIAFSTGAVKPAEGSILYGSISGATGTVKRVVTRSGVWGGGTSTAAGYVVIDVIAGTFNGTETLKLTSGAGAVQMTSTSVANPIAFAPSGLFEFANYNFTGSTSTYRMYGCDGASPAFEFDGTVLAFIRTGMAVDKPSHIAAHSNYLFLAFKGSLQNSGIGDPYAFSIVLGATEIAVGDDITGLLPMPGDANATTMAIFSKGSTRMLYGKTASDWKLVLASPTTGSIVGTSQYIGSAFVLTELGIQSISATLNYGDFAFASASNLIKQHINRLKNMATASTVYKERNQYRLFFSNGVALAMTSTGAKAAGILLIYMPNVVRCVTTGEKSDGQEYSYFGSDNGFVYQDNIGTSHDGEPIEAWLRMPFHHFGSPRYLKTFRRMTLDMIAEGYTGFAVSHELNGGDFNTEPGISQTYAAEGGYWDQFQWDQFQWDSSSVLAPVYDLTGTEKNISIIFYSNSDLYQPHSIQGVHFDYTVRRLAR